VVNVQERDEVLELQGLFGRRDALRCLEVVEVAVDVGAEVATVKSSRPGELNDSWEELIAEGEAGGPRETRSKDQEGGHGVAIRTVRLTAPS